MKRWFRVATFWKKLDPMAAPPSSVSDESPRTAGGRCHRKSKIFEMTRELRSLEPRGIFSLEQPHSTALARIGPAQATLLASLGATGPRPFSPPGKIMPNRPSRRGTFGSRYHREFPWRTGRARRAWRHAPLAERGGTTREAGSRAKGRSRCAGSIRAVRGATGLESARRPGERSEPGLESRAQASLSVKP